MPELSRALTLIRLYWGKTQSELAEEVGISQSYLSEIENGKKDVTVPVLRAYSDRLGIPMSSLMFFAEEVQASPSQRGRRIVAGKVLTLLEKLVPEHAKTDSD